VVSAARPKIADYPFTTLEPNLGVVGLSGHRSFVMADIPGIIEGAHQGKGLGLRFLQHVERTRILAFLIPVDAEDPQASYNRLQHEIRQYSPVLAEKQHVVLLTKMDLLPPRTQLPQLQTQGSSGVIPLSSASGEGVGELKELLWKLVEQAKATEAMETIEDS
jgi:GTP-binding protein